MIVLNTRFFRMLFIVYIAATCYASVTLYYNDDYKYFFLLVTAVVGLMILIHEREKIKFKNYTLIQIGVCTAVFLFISFIAMLFNGFGIYFTNDILYMVLPLLLVYVIINLDKDPNKDFYFIAIMIGELLFFLSSNLNIMFNINAYLSISFSDSYSPFEHFASLPLTAVFTYFYARKRRVLTIITFVFAFLSFKRLSVLFIIAIAAFGWLFKNKKVPIFLINLTAVVFIASPLMLDLILSPEFVAWFNATFEKTFQEFTMGRFDQITYILNYEGDTLGRGAIQYVLANEAAGHVSSTFHADLLRIYIETTIIGLIVFCFSLFNLIKIHRNFYCYFYLVFVFLTMFASVLLHEVVSMVLLLLMCNVDFDALEKLDKLKAANKIKKTSLLGARKRTNKI